MSYLFGPYYLTKAAFRMRSKRPRPERLGVGSGHVVKRYPPNHVPFKQMHRAEIRSADPRGVLQHLPEYRLQLTGRAADDLKNL